MERHRTIARRRHRRALVVVAASATAAFVATTTPATADAPAPFGVLVSQARVAYGDGPPTVIVGDSLLWDSYLVAENFPKKLANLLTGTTKRTTFVATSAGASIPNFINLGWLDGPVWGGGKLTTIANYNAFLKAHITVIALATNDVRIMHTYGDIYGPAQHRAALATAIAQARTSSTCVFLVNAANHSGPERTPSVNAVNANMDRATSDAGKVFLVDWHGHSAGHEDWFAGPGNPHHSAGGRLLYADLIHRRVLAKVEAGTC